MLIIGQSAEVPGTMSYDSTHSSSHTSLKYYIEFTLIKINICRTQFTIINTEMYEYKNLGICCKTKTFIRLEMK